MLEIRPDLPIILVTGLSETITKETRNRIGIRGFLMKPFSISEIGKTIRTILDEKSFAAEVRS
jgi:DNA-binding response OmpR family regulator